MAFLVVIGLFGAGAVIGGVVGAALLGVVALGIVGLLAATWPALTPGARAGRVAVLLVLVFVAVSMALS